MPKLSLRRKKHFKLARKQLNPVIARKRPHEDNASFVLRLAGKNSVMYRRFNFEPPKTVLINVDKKGKFKKRVFSFPKTLKVRMHPGYAFWVNGQKHIGMIMESSHIGLEYVQLQELVLNPVGQPIKLKSGRFKTKDWIVQRKAVSLNPWDLDITIRHDEPPRDVLFKPDRLERYKKSGGQAKKKGLKITIYNIEQMEREDKL